MASKPPIGPSWALSPTEWGARVDYDKWNDSYTPDVAVALHNGGGGDYRAGRAPFSVEEEMEQLRAWERFHIDGRGWRGLAYGWAVGQSGTVYRVRGWNAYGAHQGDWDGDGVSNNQDTIPILWIASGDHHLVSDAAHQSIVKLRRWIETHAGKALVLKGHREVQPKPTSCPGPNGMAYVKANRDLPEEDDMAILTDQEQKELQKFLAELKSIGSNVTFVRFMIPDYRRWSREGLPTVAVDEEARSKADQALSFLSKIKAVLTG